MQLVHPAPFLVKINERVDKLYFPDFADILEELDYYK